MTTFSSSSGQSLEPEQFHRLRDIIYEKSGIFFAENKLYLLENRLGRRLKELEISSFEEYIKFVQSQDGSAQEFIQIYNAVTINETFFFRFQAQLDAFGTKMLPVIAEQKKAAGNQEINIWSAASSSGEEVYTLAIILNEFFGTSLPQWKIELLGTDISHKALGQAQTAMFTKNSFRGAMTDQQKSRYFAEEGNGFTLQQNIKSMAQFRYLNLNDRTEIRKLRGLDFVFCRNVLIYFDEEMKKRVLNTIYDVLNHGGYLFLGEAESLHGISSAFKVEHFPGAFAYKKE
jgi:chemotaxis protein methyltransferase CheR